MKGRLSDWDAAEIARLLSKSGPGKSRKSGRGWIAPCPAHDDRKPSLSLANGDEGRLLYYCFGGCQSEDIRKALIDVIGGEEPRGPKRDGDTRREVIEDPRRPVIPVPSGVATTIQDFIHPIHGTPARVWAYRLADGGIAGWVARYNLKGGDKEFAPFIWTRHDVTGVEEMRMKSMPAPRSLYNLDKIAARTDAPVVLNEGEKAADAAERLFPDWVSTAVAGGSNAAHMVDLSPLADRDVILFADHDGPGYEFALKILERLPNSARVRMIAWPTTWPASRGGGPYALGKGDDAADHAEAGWTRDLLKEWMKEGGGQFIHRIHHLPRPLQIIHHADARTGG